MANMERSDGLRTIFSFFLGLVLTAFVGVGVYTFYPPPEQYQRQLQDLTRREQAILNAQPSGETSAEERSRLQEINQQRNKLVDAEAEARRPWGRGMSIVLIVFATVSMAVSLIRADQLPVISNGLLLGGLFTMLYGVGWILATDVSITRFLIITAALLVTLGLGYLRFVRRNTTVPASAASANEGAMAADIERRVRALEERMNDAANALGRRGDGPAAS